MLYYEREYSHPLETLKNKKKEKDGIYYGICEKFSS